jgi:hypothetical protein
VSGRSPAEPRSAFPHFLEITTRWNDNDPYRMSTTAVYYEYFDTVVNQFLIENGALDLERSDVIGLVVETQCRFFSQIAFPSKVARRAACQPPRHLQRQVRDRPVPHDEGDRRGAGPLRASSMSIAAPTARVAAAKLKELLSTIPVVQGT